MAAELTPYAQVNELFASGLTEADVAQAMRVRGFDDEHIGLLLSAHAAGPSTADVSMGPCTRCGTFVTRATHRLVLERVYCQACAARPEVDYLTAFRDAHWGKRDAPAWLAFVFMLFGIVGAFFALGQGTEVGAAVSAFSALLYGGFWAGWRPFRRVVLLFSVLYGLAQLSQGTPVGLIGPLIVYAVIQNPRNKLFFRIEPTHKELLTAWQAVHDNRVALWGRGVAFISLFSCFAWLGGPRFAYATIGAGVLAMTLSFIGLRRVDPDATPPIGQRGAAFFGLVVGALALVGATVFLASDVRF